MFHRANRLKIFPIGLGLFLCLAQIAQALTFQELYQAQTPGRVLGANTVVYNGTNGLTVTTQDLSQSVSGVVSLTVNVNQPPQSNSNSYMYIVDGKLLAWRSGYVDTSPNTYNLDTTTLVNGSHVIYIRALWWTPTGGYTDYGQWGPTNFTTANGHVPMNVLANYRETFLQPGASFKLAAFQEYTDQVKQAAANASFAVTASAPAAGVASVAADGTVTANAVGDATVTITVGSQTRDVRVVVNNQNLTPHFGKDGSILTSYDPNRSLYLRSMFFTDHNIMTSDPAYLPAFSAAAVNTFEEAFFSRLTIPRLT